MNKISALVQARMSSSRFPGKSMALLKGKPLIEHVLESASIIGKERVALLTSAHPSDGVLAHHVEAKGFAVFRGELENVFLRFRDYLAMRPCQWFFRICGDSPFLDPRLLAAAAAIKGETDCDLITNIFPRSFPVGQSIELVRSEAFLAINQQELSKAECEHVTLAFYNHPERYRILNVRCEPPARPSENFAIDTADDLKLLDAIVDRKPDYASKLVKNGVKGRS